MLGSIVRLPSRAAAVRTVSSPGLPAPIEIGVDPGVGRGLVGGVRVRVGADRGPRIVPIETVVALQHRPAVAGEVVDHADARRERVPGIEVRSSANCLAGTVTGPTVAASCRCSGNHA